MKIDAATLEILRNFSSIQEQLVVKANQPISTKADSGSLIAVCSAVQFPRDMGIYDLKQLIGTLSLCEDPSIEFKDDHLLVVDDKNKSRKVKYYYSDPDHLVKGKHVDPIEGDVNFKLTVENTKQIQRAASILGLEKVEFLGQTNECIKVIVGDKTNPTANSFEFELEEKADRNFSIVFDLSYWKMLPLDYVVKNSVKRFTCFEAPGLMYFMGQDKSSTMETL